MIQFENPVTALSYLNSIDSIRAKVESDLSNLNKVQFFCSVCDSLSSLTLRNPHKDGWIDLRGNIICSQCRFSVRHRLFYDYIKTSFGKTQRNQKVLIFEALSKFFSLIDQRFDFVKGVEYLGNEFVTGETYKVKGKDIVHQDMQNLSYQDESFDLVFHLEVLEHVPDYTRAMEEIYRVLKKNGRCVFMCPIYSRLEHIVHAVLRKDGSLNFLNGEKYHGDPLRKEGAPVFNDFGLNLIYDLKKIGFRPKLIMNYSIQKGYFSNNNPFKVGHCWPLLVDCRK